jgi:protocatechuate 3,4-dioxygenase beta subunit
MQATRSVGLLIFVVLVIAGAIGWQLLGTDPLPQLPSSDTTSQAGDPADADAETAPHQSSEEDAQATVEAASTREAVEAPDPSASDLASIVGQVVGPAGQGIADIEITCKRGFDFRETFADSDLDDANPFDPKTLTKRLAGSESKRAVTRTEADGSFRIRSEGTSKLVRLRVAARGHLLIERNVQRPTASDTDVGVLTLELGAVVAGRVVNISGKAVAGARVTRTDPETNDAMAGLEFAWPGSDAWATAQGGDSSITDQDGRFELAHVAAGKYSLRASHQDYPTATRSELSVAKGHTLADILITMPRSATIRGIVTDLPKDHTGVIVMASKKQPAASGATGGLIGMLGNTSELLGDMGFAYGESQCEITSDGKFVLKGLKADSTYRVWVSQQGRGFAGTGVCSQRVDANTDSAAVTLRYEQGVNVTFVVVDAKSGAPVESLWVRDQLLGGGGMGDMLALAPSTARQKAYPDGSVTVANLRPKDKQKLQLTIQAVGYGRFEQKNIELPETGSLDLGTVRLEPQPTIQVTVLNAYHGKPIQGAKVQLTDELGSARMGAMALMGVNGVGPQTGRTDNDGRCTLNTITDQSAELSVKRKGFAPASVSVSSSGSERSEHIVRLIEGGSVAVTVLDPDQNPVQGVSVEHQTPENSTDRRKTDANGIARFPNLTEDLHEFRIGTARAGGIFAAALANRGGNESGKPWQRVDVLDQETAELTLRKSPSATLTGIVRENGIPLEDATVTFQKGQASDGDSPLNAEALSSMMGLMNRGGSSSNKSDEEGLYSLQDLPSGNHRVRITHKGRAMRETVMVTLQDGQNRFDIELTMTTLRGVVRDSDGTPVAGAEVTVSQQSSNGAETQQVSRMMAGMMGGMGLGGSKSKTNAQGEFELRGVAANVELTVRVTAKSLSPATASATIALGQTKGPIQMTMQAAGRIEITIAKAQMFAAVQAKFVGAGAEGVEPVMQVVRGKKGALEGLKPGNWELSYLSMQNRNPDDAPKITVTVVAGQTATAEF